MFIINPRVGCGGYIKFVDAAEIAGGKTIWNKPVDVTSGPRASVCLWYIESSNIEETILLTNPQRKSSLPMIVSHQGSQQVFYF